MSSDKRQVFDELITEVRRSQNATDRFDQAVADALGLNRTDMRCLDIIEREGPVPAGRLAEETGLTSGAITTVLDRIERAGYARRVSDASDRRRVLVELTPKATRRTADIWGPMASEGSARLSGYSTQELLFLKRFLAESRDLQARQTSRLTGRPSPPPSGTPTYPPGFPGPFGSKP